MDKFSFASVISACGSKSSLELGEQVFGNAITIVPESDPDNFYLPCRFLP